MGSELFHSLSLLSLKIFLFFNLPPSAFSSMLPSNETDRLALLSFKAELNSNDPLHTMVSWNESTHFCMWEGVTCGSRHQRVIAIVLPSMGLTGTLSPAIGNTSFLREIVLTDNGIMGKIPREIGRLSRLQILVLANNSFSSEIPSNISRCLNIRYLDLGRNRLSGNIPVEFQSLSKMEILIIDDNNLTGGIPASLGNISSLRQISGAENNFQGRVPVTLGLLRYLQFLEFYMNKLSGTLPLSIFNVSSLEMIDIPLNQIKGRLPSDMGLTLPRLRWFNVGDNKFTGPIPVTLSNASQLTRLGLTLNGFTGKVPNFDRNLEWLALDYNNLGNGEADDLNFLPSLVNSTKLDVLSMHHNQLGGVLPRLIGNFSTLRVFKIQQNQIYRNIPSEIGMLANLEVFALGLSRFTGSIPDSIGNLQKLRLMGFSGTKLSGYIPSSLGNLTLLIELYLDANNLQGSIPSSIGNCKNLLVLDLSGNNLNGNIPKEIFGISSLSKAFNLSHNRLTGPLLLREGAFGNLNSFDVSNNKLSGEIPGSLGGCRILTGFFIAGNSFRGAIPPSLSSLRGLEFLDLSSNNLTGKIPSYLGSFPFLQGLNISFNDFDGEVPLGGILDDSSRIALDGNIKLCGGVPELQLPKCTIKEVSKKYKVFHVLRLVIPIACGIMVLISVLLYVCVYKRRHTDQVFPSRFPTKDMLPKVSYGSLHKATDGFSLTNLIGSGKFSSVYKGILEKYEKVVAVKVLNLDVGGATKSFIHECEALRSIRHRNLVKIFTICSSIDFQGNDFKALVYAYMENGSLESWLHRSPRVGGENEEPRSLTLLQRLSIAIDVACAIDYLHQHSGTSLVHCDLKPSNILLDKELVAHVGDFGLARFLPETKHIISGHQHSSMGIKGTIGYAAPEYGMGCEVSTYGDLYSYGILVLEIFTGKRPTDDMFHDNLSLRTFVKVAMPDRVMEILDPPLLKNEGEEEETATGTFQGWKPPTFDNFEKCLSSVFRVGIACSVELPRERMAISDVITELQLTRDRIKI
ncbi:hypothetical protein RJ640_011601 [Escallonia rubra]|uniref:non-specific serine/threonine protein kinase n=1 Tax=Escallonia rubra TaxID=112253 RepID=A0AA88UW31_9ASTE|nr:hypothetical protein RJ640_011601 [Escallonia rubra]